MAKKNPILFLDYDGVVNTVYWAKYDRNSKHPRGVFRADFANPSDGFVNNFQAICWLNELHKINPYDIVVTSTWRYCNPKDKPDNWKEVLYNGGLDKNIKVIGRTPKLDSCRGDEIKKWIDTNKYDGDFVILDDDSDMGDYMEHLVKCDPALGFTIYEFSDLKKGFEKNKRNKNKDTIIM